jgi:hypothetical protein
VAPPEVIPLDPNRDSSPESIGTRPLWDLEFEKAHTRLKRLSNHILQVTTPFDATVQEAARLGELNLIEFASLPARGRRATGKEWHEVESRTHTIWAALSEPQRRKFITTQVPGWFSYLMSVLLGLVIFSILAACLIQSRVWKDVAGDLLMPFMMFVIALGAIGASASIGMNALSVQDDATFDISSGKFLWLRLVLGALLGTMLTFPWAFPVFQAFVAALLTSPVAKVDIKQEQFTQALWLLMPFVLGFSTSLVILVLSRAVEAVQTFFGKTAQAKSQTG